MGVINRGFSYGWWSPYFFFHVKSPRGIHSLWFARIVMPMTDGISMSSLPVHCPFSCFRIVIWRLVTFNNLSFMVLPLVGCRWNGWRHHLLGMRQGHGNIHHNIIVIASKQIWSRNMKNWAWHSNPRAVMKSCNIHWPYFFYRPNCHFSISFISVEVMWIWSSPTISEVWQLMVSSNKSWIPFWHSFDCMPGLIKAYFEPICHPCLLLYFIWGGASLVLI